MNLIFEMMLLTTSLQGVGVCVRLIYKIHPVRMLGNRMLSLGFLGKDISIFSIITKKKVLD